MPSEMIRVSTDMDKLLQETISLFRSKGIVISKVEASRYLARKIRKQSNTKVEVEPFDIRL